ncbi:hypothetical protein FJZ53_06165 [Candidatus Woesearchaeota archaeon]|nr:hypothetical protein [Candidatus Woesearchaeota archaeon]
MVEEGQEFYDRAEELGILREKYAEIEKYGKGAMLAMYGRRRVGKTELIRRFMNEDVKGSKLYFYVDLAEKKVLLDSLSKAVQEQLKESVAFSEFDDFFKYVISKSERSSLVLVIDEFQRFADVAPEAITSLQKHWDLTLKNRKVMIALVGSSTGMMQKITGGKAGALYGRASRMKISPFKYKDFRLMFEELDEEEKIVRYAVFGGTPYYLEKTKRFKDTIEAVQELMLKKDGDLSEEPKNLLEYENVRVHAKYNSILQSISSGKEILKEIQDFTRISSTTLPPYINKLDHLLDLIEKNNPLLGKERLRRYRIKDNFFRFWYKFVFESQTALNMGNRELVFNIIRDGLNSYVGRVFEDVAKELLVCYNGKEINGMRMNFENIGGWWDRSGNEIDIMAYNKKEKTLLVGEAKWSSNPVDVDVVDDLFKKSKSLGIGGKYVFLVVSKSGFTERCVKKMQENKFLYLDIKDINRLFSSHTK